MDRHASSAGATEAWGVCLPRLHRSARLLCSLLCNRRSNGIKVQLGGHESSGWRNPSRSASGDIAVSRRPPESTDVGSDLGLCLEQAKGVNMARSSCWNVQFVQSSRALPGGSTRTAVSARHWSRPCRTRTVTERHDRMLRSPHATRSRTRALADARESPGSAKNGAPRAPGRHVWRAFWDPW
jgi:hypothetical protein